MGMQIAVSLKRVQKIKRLLVFCVWGVVGCGKTYALSSHEVILVINETSPDSLEIGHYYAQMRSIPPENIFYVSLPRDSLQAVRQMEYAEFQSKLYRPVESQIQARGLTPRILAWIYSVDFPVRIIAPNRMPLSLQGATLSEGFLPSPDEISKGSFISPYFAGDAVKSEWAGRPLSLRRPHDATGYPSMMLGYTEARGNTIEEIRNCIQKSAGADGSNPQGGIRLVKHEDVRSTCRDWQYGLVAESLRKMGVDARVVTSFPSADESLMGILYGRDWAPAWTLKGLLPGSLGEHLTSGAANFDWRYQTKITEWIRAGASASAGTVSEPYANWMKFPAAAFFLYYVSGCSMLESFYQSVRSPLQLLMVGDPLARPYGQFFRFRLLPLGLNTNFEAFSFMIDGYLPYGENIQKQVFLDGRRLPPFSSFPLRIPLAEISDGYHEIRFVVSTDADVPTTGYDVAGFEVSPKGRSVVLRLNDGESVAMDYYHPRMLDISFSEPPVSIEIRQGLRVLSSGLPGVSSTQWLFDPRQTGCGPVTLQAVGRYEDGMEVASSPLTIAVTRTNTEPDLIGWNVQTNKDTISFLPVFSDPEQDAVEFFWQENLDLMESDSVVVENKKSGVMETSQVFRLSGQPAPTFRRLDATMRVEARDPGGLSAGLVFGYQNKKNYGFWGLHGDSSSWRLERIRNGKSELLFQIGRPILPGHSTRLILESTPDGNLIGRIDGEKVFSVKAKGWRLNGRIGVIDANPGIFQEGFFCSPPLESNAQMGNSHSLLLPLGATRSCFRISVFDEFGMGKAFPVPQ